MNKAFLFDMDGVIIDSEPSWEEVENEYLTVLFGKEVAEKMGSLVGIGLAGLMERAASLGAVFDHSHVTETFEEIARKVYTQSPITEGINELVSKLVSANFRIGIVTQSPHTWIDQVVPRLPFRKNIDIVISLHDHPELRNKPEPGGYNEALRLLSAKPEHSFILEDSNPGIQAGKASRCHVIGFRGNLVESYKQDGADAYADTIDEVVTLVETLATKR